MRIYYVEDEDWQIGSKLHCSREVERIALDFMWLIYITLELRPLDLLLLFQEPSSPEDRALNLTSTFACLPEKKQYEAPSDKV